jgi:serine/threonine protein kinase
MTAPRPDNEAIFHAARDIPEAGRRREYVREACAGDETRIALVEALLAAADTPDSLLDRPAGSAAAVTVELPPAGETPGATIGPYKLIEQLGEGGMGSVWMAQQTEPVKRLVAIKLIKAGMDSKQVLARFEAERQALALMDHPNIAKVLEAGTTTTGRPYFVMDLVKGVPITRYCDDHHLTPRQRLELFLPVCQAVQHAHQKGIIHRDLKPSNVLVAQYDGRPVPRVIDFGVAKAAGQSLTDKTLVTGFGNIIGTLEYMSPEQAEINQLDIDTRSDIYSLGVMLYELLAGSPPFSRKDLENAGMLEMLRVIREQEPSKPSTKLSSSDALPTLSTNRGTEPAKLTRLVRGELDWIVMKALEKDRNRRYETANGFALDVQRYLADEPVLACPPSILYRFRKFARRNKAILAATAGGLLVAALGIAGLIANNWRVAREKTKTEAALETARAEKVRADENLARARKAVRDYLAITAGDPRLRAADLQALRKNLLATAVPFFEEFAALQSDDPNAEAERAQAIFQLAQVYGEMGEIDKARADYARARDIFAALATAHPQVPKYREDLAVSRYNLGNMLEELHRPGEAEVEFTAALEGIERLRAEDDRIEYRQHLAAVHTNRGVLFSGQKNHREAAEEYRRAATILEKLIADAPTNRKYLLTLAANRGNLANALNEQGAGDAALAMYREALAVKARLVELDSTNRDYRDSLARSQNNLGTLLQDRGDTDGAEAAYKEAREIWAQLAADFRGIPDYRHALAQSYYNRGNLLKEQHDPVGAIGAYRQAVAILITLARDFPRNPTYQQHLEKNANNLGRLLLDNNQPAEAAAAFRTAVTAGERLTADYPEDPGHGVTLGGDRVNLGIALRDDRQSEAALESLTRAIGTLRPLAEQKSQPANARWFLRNAHWNRAQCLMDLKRYKEALSDWDRSHELSAERERWTFRVGRMEALVLSGDHAKATAEADAAAHADAANAGILYDTACIHAQASEAAATDRERAERYAIRAIELLRQAIAKGYTDVDHLKKDPDLKPLYSRQAFAKLVAELESRVKK